MPWPGMPSPQWQKLSELYGCSFSDTFSRVMKMQYRLVLITAGASMPCAHLRELEVPHFDIRRFFPARNIREVDCRGKTAFSHSDVWDDFLGPEIFEARSFVLEALAEASGTTFWEPDGTTVVCVILCKHGLHRSQAVARHIGNLLVWQGCSVCVLNSAMFDRRRNSEYRALVKLGVII